MENARTVLPLGLAELLSFQIPAALTKSSLIVGQQPLGRGRSSSDDYVNNTVTYAISGSKYPAQTALSEKMVNSFSGFNAYQTLSVVDELGKIYVVQSSGFQPQRTFLNTRTDNGIAYKFTDNSAAPVTNQNEVISAAEVDDPKTNKPGVAVVRYANATRNFTFSDGKPESVQFPNDYVEHLLTKYREVANAASAARSICNVRSRWNASICTKLVTAKAVSRAWIFRIYENLHLARPIQGALCNRFSQLPAAD